jgi:hypothetical protein
MNLNQKDTKTQKKTQVSSGLSMLCAFVTLWLKK